MSRGNDETRYNYNVYCVCIQTGADALTAGNEAVVAEASRQVAVARVSRTLLVTPLSANSRPHMLSSIKFKNVTQKTCSTYGKYSARK